MKRRYHTLDVFTDAPLAGNPVAVILDSDDLDSTRMQAIAREFNLSETVFVAPPRDPSNSAAVRIFTPSVELPFAGHPIIGTAVLLGKLRAPELLGREDVGLALEAEIGVVACSVRHRRGEAAHARFDVPKLPERAGEPPALDDIAAMLGIETEDVGFGAYRPCCFSAGNTFLFVPIRDLDALGRACLRASGRDKIMTYLFAAAQSGTALRFRSRMLSAGYGVPEDPATGSAAAAFAGVLAEFAGLPDGQHDCYLEQGVEMGRPSRIGLALAIEDGRLDSAAIGGHAVMVGQGTIDL